MYLDPFAPYSTGLFWVGSAAVAFGGLVCLLGALRLALRGSRLAGALLALGGLIIGVCVTAGPMLTGTILQLYWQWILPYPSSMGWAMDAPIVMPPEISLMWCATGAGLLLVGLAAALVKTAHVDAE
jgi:hypothetical protein